MKHLIGIFAAGALATAIVSAPIAAQTAPALLDMTSASACRRPPTESELRAWAIAYYQLALKRARTVREAPPLPSGVTVEGLTRSIVGVRPTSTTDDRGCTPKDTVHDAAADYDIRALRGCSVVRDSSRNAKYLWCDDLRNGKRAKAKEAGNDSSH